MIIWKIIGVICSILIALGLIIRSVVWIISQLKNKVSRRSCEHERDKIDAHYDTLSIKVDNIENTQIKINTEVCNIHKTQKKTQKSIDKVYDYLINGRTKT